jgi:chromosome partitioning protein
VAHILAIVNQKGGVGKTTTAVNLASSLALAGRATLLVDLDPQVNATAGVGGDAKAGVLPTIYEVLLDEAGATDAVRVTPFVDLALLPSTTDLVGAELELSGRPGRERRLDAVLGPLSEKFAYIVIDTPPSLGLLTLNALVAADRVIVPLQCEYYALEGLAQLMRTLEVVRAQANPRLAVGGILLTMFDGRTSLALQVRSEVERYFRDLLFKTVIPRNVRITEAPSHGRPIAHYDLRSAGAVAYLEVAREVLKHDEAGTWPRARSTPASGG